MNRPLTIPRSFVPMLRYVTNLLLHEYLFWRKIQDIKLLTIEGYALSYHNSLNLLQFNRLLHVSWHNNNFHSFKNSCYNPGKGTSTFYIVWGRSIFISAIIADWSSEYQILNVECRIFIFSQFMVSLVPLMLLFKAEIRQPAWVRVWRKFII